MWVRRKEWDELTAEVRRLKEQRISDQLELTQRLGLSAYSSGMFARHSTYPVTRVVELILDHLGFELGIRGGVPEGPELRKKFASTQPTFTGTITKVTKQRPK